MPQFHRSDQVEVAPRTVLGLVAELFVRVRQQLSRFLVTRIGEHQMVHQLRCPAVVAVVERLLTLGQKRVRPADGFDVAFAVLHRRMRIQVSGNAVEPTEIEGVDRFDVVAERAVVPAVVPLLSDGVGNLDLVGNLYRCQPLVGKAQRLVVEILVQVCLIRHELQYLVVAPRRPMMLRENDFDVGEQLHRQADVVRPGLGIASLGAAQRVQIVHRVRDVLS